MREECSVIAEKSGSGVTSGVLKSLPGHRESDGPLIPPFPGPETKAGHQVAFISKSRRVRYSIVAARNETASSAWACNISKIITRYNRIHPSTTFTDRYNSVQHFPWLLPAPTGIIRTAILSFYISRLQT